MVPNLKIPATGEATSERRRQLDSPPRNVKTRNRNYKHLPVIALSQNGFMTEKGEIGLVADLVTDLPTMASALFAKVSAADFVAYLNGVYLLKYPDTWQWRAAANERDIVRPDGFRLASRVTTVIHYFGWKGGYYHKIIDPISMYGHNLDNIWPGEESKLERLLRWAVCLRDFCEKSGIEIRPTTGSLASQFLTDPRFYPNNRRKVPAAINESVRAQLPGNYYHLGVTPKPEHEFTAYYLDQHRAHHYHASQTALPNGNTLYAHGTFTTLHRCVFENVWDNFYGLYCLDLERPPKGTPGRWAPYRWIDGGERVFVYSNELPHLLDLGYRVLGVRAAWGSRHRDNGLGEYARWAMLQLDSYGDPRWLKQLLLSTYGVLATAPRERESIFRLAANGDPIQLRTGHRQLNGRHTKSTRKLEPGIANVLHRGMIEAATRSESVGLAQWLNNTGHRVLSIYADAVIVEVGETNLPELPEPWRLKRQLNHLQFINQQAFISGEMTKLPGISRELMKYRQRVRGKAPTEKTMYEALSGREIKVKIGQHASNL